MKTLGQIAYEARNPEGPNWQSTGDLVHRDYERLADAVAAEAIERFKASLEGSELLGKIAYNSQSPFGESWASLTDDDRKWWSMVAGFVERAVLKRQGSHRSSPSGQAGEPLGKTAFNNFHGIHSENMAGYGWGELESLNQEWWNKAALAVKARVLAEMEAQVVSDAKRAAGHPTTDIAGILDKLNDPKSALVPVDEYLKPELVERLLNPLVCGQIDHDGTMRIQKPEPSLLEVAAMIFVKNRGSMDAPSNAVDEAAELIAAVREHEKASK